MSFRKVAIWMIIMVPAWTHAISQERLINFKCDTIPFSAFVNQLQQAGQVVIYYHPPWTDSLFVSIDQKEGSVGEILEEALAGSDLTFIQQKNRFILSKDYTIKTDFDKDVKDAYASYKEFHQGEQVEYRPLVRETEEEATINPEYQLHRIGNPARFQEGDEAVISGYIRDKNSGESLIGAVVFLEELNIGAAANAYGFYSIQVPGGQITLEYSCMGMKSTRRNVQLYSEGTLNVEMEEEVLSLKEVTISANGQQNLRSVSLGMEKISIKQLKEIPMALGEVDVIRSVTLLPGVQTVGEGTTGFNVRGGSADQNLIQLDRAPIMNPSHFMGFFSSVNADLLKDATLYKSSIPARYGGRISSVFDLQTRDGSKKKIGGSGGISPVMGKLLIEGPMVEDKSTFLLGARSSYSNWILKQLEDVTLQQSSAWFMDVNGKFTFDLNEKNSLYASGYYSRDHFDYYSETAYKYSNAAATVTWKNVLNNKLFSLYSLVYSSYRYRTSNTHDTLAATTMDYKLDQYKADIEYTWYPVSDWKVNFGLNSTWYNLNPGSLEPYGSRSLVIAKDLEKEHGLESALFFSGDYDINSRITVSGGLRASSLLRFGPGTQYLYTDPEERSTESISGTRSYDAGQLSFSDFHLEPRVSARIAINNKTSIKLGYTRMAQYLQMLSNTTAISPTDIWMLSNSYLLPQVADQLGAGFFRNFMGNSLETSLEVYYRKLDNIVDYKGGAELVMNDHIETDVLSGTGKAYGAELLLKRTKGKLTGWVSYTYSRIFHKIVSDNPEYEVNEGNYFPANYDKPNNLSFVGNYRVSRRLSFSTTIDYSDGRPVTYPLASYEYMGGERLQYSNRNSYRIPYYFRWDLSINIEGNLKVNKLAHSSITLGLYNVTGRNNAYSVFYRTEEGEIKGYLFSVFGSPIPTITYNFKF